MNRNADNTNNGNLLTVDQVAAYLQLAPQTIYNMVSEERLPCYRINGKCVRFKKEEIDEWLAKSKQQGRTKRIPSISDSS